MTASLRQLASVEAYQAFRERYGRPPVWMALAPGRVNLIGEHVDYNDGFVLPMAIDRYTVVAAAPLRTTSESSRVYSRAIRASCEIPHGERTPQQLTDMPHWARYVAGTFNTCRYAGLVAPPLELLIHSTVPVGGGLSSSAALEVATATLLETICERALDPRDKVLRCQQAEHEYAGMPCGVMDQFAVTLGQADHALLLDCRSLQVQPIPLGESAPRVLIINSNVKHELGNSAYAMRRAECQQAAELLGVASLRDVTPSRLAQAGRDLPDSLYRRARHVVTEIERTTALADAFQIQDWRRAGELMHASHVSLRDDYEVSCQELDLLVELTQSQGVERGVFGSRMTGGGFGGCTVSLVEAATADEVAADVVAQYRTATGITPHAFCTQAAAGAERINLSTMAESVANDGLS